MSGRRTVQLHVQCSEPAVGSGLHVLDDLGRDLAQGWAELGDEHIRHACHLPHREYSVGKKGSQVYWWKYIFECRMPAVAQYYYFDGLGSTVMMTQGLSTITDRYDYDAWGNEYPIMVSTLDNPYRYVGQLGYYTHWMDSSLTDLLHLGVRFYEPGVGRFSQVDPAGEGWNWYVYLDGRPTVGADPDGLCAIARAACRIIDKMKCAQNWKDWWQRNYPWDKQHDPPAFGREIHDKVGHCFVTCKLIKDCGFSRDQALALGMLKEIGDYIFKRGRDSDDKEANRLGADIACRPDSNCLPDCLQAVKNRFGKGRRR